MRRERDTMGWVDIPENALWGAQTQRAVENFPISGERFGRDFIWAVGLVKLGCAQANQDMGLLDERRGAAIIQACREVMGGDWDEHFPIDVFQTGSGTSTNMNANEVIANRAIQILGGEIGSRGPVHPQDHVNLSQSSNDVIPTAIHLAAIRLSREKLIPALHRLGEKLQDKSEAYQEVIKTGRTHLQDALPIRMGQVFSGYAGQVQDGRKRAERAIQVLSELPLGGTAVGTGANRPKGFPELAVHYIGQHLDGELSITRNHVQGNASRDELVEVSGLLKTIAVSLTKIANDLRWMASGPRAGLNELKLERVQPGSSMMPGKNNPVIAEALIMAAAQVIGNDAAVTQGGLGGYFEINLMMPLLARNIMGSMILLANAVSVFAERAVSGVEVHQDRCREMVERNLSVVTFLVRAVGHDRAEEISQEAFRSDRTIPEVAREQAVLPAEELEKLLDLERMTGPYSID